jgi:hypothetical protein
MAPLRDGAAGRRTRMTAPYLTLVFTGRNDGFGGDFSGRFLRALEFNHAALTEAGVPHDFVYVEWRPVPGRPYLADLLHERLVRDLGADLTSVIVDAAYHDALSLNPRMQFHEFIAKNVGIRRAAGRFVLATNSDVYLSRSLIGRLAAGGLNEGTLYRTVRIDVKSSLDLTCLDWSVLEDSRNYDVVNAIRPPLYTNASGDFQLLDRGSYHRLRGFNEVYRVAKIHIDSNLCVKARAAGVPIEDIGAPVYHVGRGTLNAMWKTYRDRPHEAPWGDIRWHSEVIYENGPGWGLGDAPCREVGARMYYLDFDWSAVGPMVELRRISMPAARRRASAPA